jgi:ABC-type glycerol-3-phosphate transport system permease component
MGKAAKLRKIRRLVLRWPVYLFLVAYTLFALFPVVLMWINALKDPLEYKIEFNPLAFPKKITLENLEKAWLVGHMGTYMRNSIIVAVPRVIGILILSSLAGYAFGKLRFPGMNTIFYLMLFGMMIPIQAMLIPLYYNLQRIGMINNFWAMIVPNFGIMMPFAVFFMRSFFRDLPAELMDSARIDGSNDFKAFVYIMLPLTTPALTTMMVLQFLWSWNDFLMPLMLIYEDKLRTLPLGIMFYLVGGYYLDQGLVSAAVTISSLPIICLYIVFQRSFVSGITAGAIKG